MREREAIELSRKLSEAFPDLDLNQNYHHENPTVIGIQLSRNEVFVACPFCGQGHVHGEIPRPEYRGAHCRNGNGYWIVSIDAKEFGIGKGSNHGKRRKF